MGWEFELKFAAKPEQLIKIQQDFGSIFQQISMETTYYDTPDHLLSRQHDTLRRRLENGRSICTVKTPVQGPGRGEWEVECCCIDTAIPKLCKLGAPQWLHSLDGKKLVPLCGARFNRQAALLRLRDCTVELALDQGVLIGAGQTCQLCELEIELKSGSPEAARTYAQKLAEKYSLLPENQSKFRRALALTEKK